MNKIINNQFNELKTLLFAFINFNSPPIQYIFFSNKIKLLVYIVHSINQETRWRVDAKYLKF